MLAYLTRVVSADTGLQLVMRQPFAQDVGLECLPAAARVALPACPNPSLGVLPGIIGVLLDREGAGKPFLTADVYVVAV
jgi:hypothetical protein